ncbi:TetR/AcrR family transcriptional regulator [Desulfotomaculum copahuensis]|uniref:HTH tetR-type domain-containing protein n=1 Tax=Desulfotomaculum copahuensis TaxID=1838280 RepID=A0A1B7LKL7_9FIRM|nr:TetR/AcrR family transcriptional regulator [Desulfotomaculum copahuensis]OAT87083.1 hypothetical protein A6M21_01990 [Desulfotomaculum copahuensis]
MDLKEKILSTMKDLARQKGFHAVTTDELAAACGISKRTLYRYFTGKDEIVARVLDEMMNRVDQRVQEIMAGPAAPPEKLRALVQAVLENIRFLDPNILSDLQRHYPHRWEQIEQFRTGRIERLGEIFSEGARRGFFREINPDVLMAALTASIRAVINPEFILARAISLPQAFDTLMEIFLYGISRVEGRDK